MRRVHSSAFSSRSAREISGSARVSSSTMVRDAEREVRDNGFKSMAMTVFHIFTSA